MVDGTVYDKVIQDKTQRFDAVVKSKLPLNELYPINHKVQTFNCTEKSAFWVYQTVQYGVLDKLQRDIAYLVFLCKEYQENIVYWYTQFVNTQEAKIEVQEYNFIQQEAQPVILAYNLKLSIVVQLLYTQKEVQA